ncbi:hypothetical protein [Stieleria varia]|uniref:Uncharacterized protein n=1 Tax=Stieleria varia TaxID=2528005 RepID=A0A5C6B9C7_9BACT|nr:hypothetical protein [Stieleria varia]TWU07866.1 hypothetical protein Pla52n_04420 [Stieleria varia]
MRPKITSKMSIRVIIMVGLLIHVSQISIGNDFEVAVKSAADSVAEILGKRNESRVSAKYQGFGNLPGGNEVGFLELFRNALADHGVVLSNRAGLSFEARVVRTDASDSGSKGMSAQLVGQLIDDRGSPVGQRIECYPMLTDGADLARQSGISSHLISRRGGDSASDSSERFRRDYDAKTIYVGDNGRDLYSNPEVLYGVSVIVGNQYRRLGEPAGSMVPEGLAYTTLNLGEEYSIELINNSDHECAVQLKIDGLSPFHFADQSVRKSNGELPRFFVIPAKSRQRVKGWVKDSTRLLRFKVTPLAESAVAVAGVPIENVGMVSLTFHACWQKGQQPPAGEPEITKNSERPNVIYQSVTKTRRRADGTLEEYTVQVPVMQTRIETGTGFGTEESTDIRGVTRKIGVPRAVVAFRYNR